MAHKIRPFSSVFTAGTSWKVNTLTGALEGSSFVLRVNGAPFKLPILEQGTDRLGPWAAIEPMEVMMQGGHKLEVAPDTGESDVASEEGGGLQVSVTRIEPRRARAMELLSRAGRDAQVLALLVLPGRSMCIYFDADGVAAGEEVVGPDLNLQRSILN